MDEANVMLLKRITRRNFIAYTAIHSSLALFFPSRVFALCSTATKPIHNKYLFSDQSGLGPEINAPIIEQRFCALHQEEAVPQPSVNSQQYKAAALLLKNEFEKAGLAWDDSYQIALTFQHYGVPEDSSYVSELLEYCERVNDFLYNRLTNLLEVDVDWQRLFHGGPHTDRSHIGFRGFVGRYTYYVLRVTVCGESSNIDLPYLVSAWPLERAINHIVGGASHTPTKGIIYIIPGATSLVAPFSELMHLTLHAASQRYADELSKNMPREVALKFARVAGETANEAAATLLATEFLRIQNCKEKQPMIDLVAQSMASQYPFVTRAIAYMKQHGLQPALNLYQNSPSEFMRKQKG